jgi:hypothetical protein
MHRAGMGLPLAMDHLSSGPAPLLGTPWIELRS